MAAIGLGKTDVARFLRPEVTVACENSPSSTTLAGDEKALEKVMADINGSDEDIFVRRLQVEIAYHSGMCALYSLTTTFSHVLKMLTSGY